MKVIRKVLRSLKARFGLLIAIVSFVLRFGSSALDWIGRGETLSEGWKHVSASAVGRWGYPTLLVAGICLIVWAVYDVEKRSKGVPDVILMPSSGPSDRMFLAVTNNGDTQKFHAACAVVARRNDPNPLHKRTYDLLWDRDSAREVVLLHGESSNLVIATADADYKTRLEEVFLIGLVDGKRDAVEHSRWTIRDRLRPPPEYDLDVYIFSDQVGLIKKEGFVLKCGGSVSALEMVSRTD